MRRNEFSSTTEVSKRAGLIAVLSSSRTSVAVVRAGAAAARARARARRGRVVVVVARGRSVSNTSYEPIVRAPAKARGRTGAACDVVTPRASTRPGMRARKRAAGGKPRAAARDPSGGRGRSRGEAGGKRAGAHRVALARRGAREGRAHPATRARRADAPPPRRDQCPGDAPTKARKCAADTRANADERSIADRSKSALVPPVKTVEVRRSNRSGRAE